jgi:hypothetical protein
MQRSGEGDAEQLRSDFWYPVESLDSLQCPHHHLILRQDEALPPGHRTPLKAFKERKEIDPPECHYYYRHHHHNRITTSTSSDQPHLHLSLSIQKADFGPDSDHRHYHHRHQHLYIR